MAWIWWHSTFKEAGIMDCLDMLNTEKNAELEEQEPETLNNWVQECMLKDNDIQLLKEKNTNYYSIQLFDIIIRDYYSR